MTLVGNCTSLQSMEMGDEWLTQKDFFFFFFAIPSARGTLTIFGVSWALCSVKGNGQVP